MSLQAAVLGSQSALGCNVNNENDLARIVFERHFFPINRNEGDILQLFVHMITSVGLLHERHTTACQHQGAVHIQLGELL